MYTESDSRFSVRSLLVKIFIILIIIIVLIWIVPKFLSYKKGPKSTKKTTPEVAQVTKISASTLRKLENAGLKYFNKDNIPTEESKSVKVTLKDLKKQGLVTDLKSNNNVCDTDSSYVKLTKNKDDYTMKSYLKCGSSSDYSLASVNDYSYCSSTLLCKKDDSIKTEDGNVDNNPTEGNNTSENNTNDNSSNNSNNNSNSSETKKLSDFTAWQSYVRTSCDTKAVTCDINDTNCLQEVKLFSRKEIIGTKTTTNTFDHTALKYVSTKTSNTCPSYNYVVINNTIFRTKGNYGEVLQLNKNSTNSWTYKGQVSNSTAPRFGGNEYYKYVGTENNMHYYDYYKYNYAMEQVSSLTSGCSSAVSSNVNYYSVYKQQETYQVVDNVYATACYKSVRTRTYK